MKQYAALATYFKGLQTYKHFALLSLYGFAQIWFSYLEHTIRPQYYMYSFLDAYIPFVKIFVVPYLFWFAYMALGFIYLGIVSKQDFYRLCVFLFGGMAVCYIIYAIFPSAQNLRPIITENDVFSRAIKHIYSTDTPTNVAPSIHVLNSIAVHVALIRCPEFAKRLWAKRVSLALMLLISASTVLIKQHSIKDVMWAAGLALVLYALIYHLPKWIVERNQMVVKTREARVE